MKRWRWLAVALMVATSAAASPAGAAELPPGGTFIDDDGNLHEGNIEAIHAVGITKGCNPPAQRPLLPR